MHILKVPPCPYCGGVAKLFETSERFYHGTDFGPVWACVPCGAWVGCHRNSKKFAPLGRLATAELRTAKIGAHTAFDRLWKSKMRRDGCSKGEARSAGYRWLAEQLGIDPKDCHIGMMDVDQCRRVVTVCSQIGKKAA